jgi:predicted AlkP superfamily pyrophosphatase or phosphodiesterase
MGGDPDAFLALNAAKGFGFVGGYTGDYPCPSPVAGTHGYFPDDPNMQPSMIIYGHGVSHGVIDGGRLIDVGPTIASWLGLGMSGATGRSLLRLNY